MSIWITEKSVLKKGNNVPQKIIFCDKNFVAIHLDIVEEPQEESC